MPTNKDFKRLVRGRMQKTGESYTAARATLIRSRRATKPAAVAAVVPPYAALAGMSDDKVKAATGCTWERWVRALDRVEAHSWPHARIAKYVRDTYKTPSWWTQTVTVGYERIKGLRARGQQRDGTYQTSRAKTIRLPVAAVYRAFGDGRMRARWLPPGEFTVRSAAKGKRIRLAAGDGAIAEVVFVSKGDRRSLVSVEVRKLASQADATRWKSFWSERLATLAQVLSTAATV